MADILLIENDKGLTVHFSKESNRIDYIYLYARHICNFDYLYKDKLTCNEIGIEYKYYNKSNIIPKKVLQITNIQAITIKNGALEKLNDNDSLSEYFTYIRLYHCYINIIPKAWNNANIIFFGLVYHDDGEYSYYKARNIQKEFSKTKYKTF